MAIKPYKVTRTITYYPRDGYMEVCTEEERIPTQEGFKDFITDWIYEDFNRFVGELDELTIEEEV